MSSLSMRSLGRRKIAAIALAFAAFGGFAAYRTQSSAHAHLTEVTLGMTCKVATLTIPIDVSYGVEHTPDTPVSGEAFTVKTSTTVSMPADAPPLPLKSIAITIPVPFGVIGGNDITATGGNLTKAGQTNGADAAVLTLTANAGVTTKTVEMPVLTIPVTIADEVPETIIFEGPSKLSLTIDGLNEPVACTANDGNPPLVSVKPTGGKVVAAPTTTKKPSTGGGSEEETEKKPTAVKASPRYTG